jgi:hypothetical protein
MASVQTMGAKPKKVVVVADWKRCTRAVHWQDELTTLNPDVIDEFLVFPLADSLAPITPEATQSVAPITPVSLLQALATRQVLVLNFDSINGDPGFGSDIALDWFRHRYPELLHWVAQGGILIVEGQTMLSVPTQASYDALFGHRELRVSGPSEKLVPGVEWRKIGGDCKITSKARKYKLFEDIKPGSHTITCPRDLTLDYFFPGNAKLMLSSASALPSWRLLYRGWFSKLPVFRRQFRWVPLIETAHRRFNQAVLKGARHGKGVMFVSTMFLAGTAQTKLIRDLLTWNARENPLPTLGPWQRKLMDKGIQALIPIIAAVIVTEVLGLRYGWEIWWRWLLWVGFSVASWLVILLAQWLWRTVCDFLGV